MQEGSEKKEERRDKPALKILIIATIFALSLIVFFIASNISIQPEPKNSQPEVLSYEGHPVGYGYVVYVNILNKGDDGWIKATVEASTLSGPSEMTVITSSQRTYLKKGESGVLQFAFEYFIDGPINVSTQSVNEGGPPEVHTSSIDLDKIYATYHIGSFSYPDWIGWYFQRVNKENTSFSVTFFNFTYEGTLGNGSKVYLMWANLTNMENRSTLGSPLPPMGLCAKSLKSYPGLEISLSYFKPMESRIAWIMFIIPASENPYWISWSEDEFHSTMLLLGPP
jgi:hypothetical protein